MNAPKRRGFVLCLAAIAVVACVAPEIRAQPAPQPAIEEVQFTVDLQTIKLVLDDMDKSAKNQEFIMAESYASDARKRLLLMFKDPTIDNLDAWKYAARAAIQLKDDDLGAYAFEAIQRLDPNLTTDKESLDLVARLNRLKLKQTPQQIQEGRQWFMEQWVKDKQLSTPQNENDKSMNATRGEVKFQLAEGYRTGTGVPKNEVASFDCLKVAASMGNADAMNGLGLALSKNQQWDNAFMCFKSAADLGNGPGINNLGTCYLNGHGVAKDEDQAAKLFIKAADMGVADAMYSAGWAYDYGRGVGKDSTKAIRYYRLAMLNGSDLAKSRLKELSAKCGRVGIQIEPADGVEGMKVVAVSPNSPSFGLILVGDIVTAVNGVPCTNAMVLQKAVAESDPPARIQFTIFHDGKTSKIMVTTAVVD
jgi:TPR repeat protein